MDILRDLLGIASCIGFIIVGIRSLPKILGSGDKEE